MFDLSVELHNLKPDEINLFYRQLPDILRCQFEACTIEISLLADLLSLQRLYNTYKVIQHKKGLTVRDLYHSILDDLWNIMAGNEMRKKKLAEYADLEEVAELLACGTQEDFNEDYIRPFCEKYFSDILLNIDISMIEMEFITYCSYLIQDMNEFSYCSAESHLHSPIIYNHLLDLAYSITEDHCLESKQNIFLQPYFLQEINDCRDDCLSAYHSEVLLGKQKILELHINYLSKFFLDKLYTN